MVWIKFWQPNVLFFQNHNFLIVALHLLYLLFILLWTYTKQSDKEHQCWAFFHWQKRCDLICIVQCELSAHQKQLKTNIGCVTEKTVPEMILMGGSSYLFMCIFLAIVDLKLQIIDYNDDSTCLQNHRLDSSCLQNHRLDSSCLQKLQCNEHSRICP